MWFATILVVALVGSGRLHGASAKESCQLTLQTDLDPSKEPLVLQVSETQIRSQVETLEIPWPKVVNGKGVITVNDGDELLLVCLGKKNDVSGNNKKSTYIRCDNGKLMEGNKKATKETNSCTRIYSESFLKVTDERCGSGDNTGTVLELGFELNEKSWFPLVDVCHNIDSAVSYYASHELYGHSLRGAVKSSERRKFSRGPKSVFPTVNPDSVYTRKGQEKAFDRILGAGGSNMYINNTFFLSRGHLAPDADFIYNSGQLLTYYYVNVAPQWQPFNAGNWLSIESTVRNLAIKVDDTLNVYTGTYGILKLKNPKGQERMMYLDPVKKLIPVPEVYWKLVQNPVTKSCTVAVGHNNVYLTEPPTPICKTVSPKGWPTLDTLSKGYTYYCDYKSFKKVVPFVPNLQCTDLFNFPS